MSEVLLVLDKVSKSYYSKSYKFAKTFKLKKKLDYLERATVRAVDDIYLEVYEGEILGLLGPNGAGKSTTLKMICGLIEADSGSIRLGGKDIHMNTPEAREGMGALIESPSFYMKMSAMQNLRFLASLQGGVTEERIVDMAKLLEINDRLNDRMSSYSMGMLQKIGIIQAIMHKPRLLILDEPTNGLDPKWIIEVREILRKLAKEYNMTIIISSHILSEMQELCDRVAIIDKGAIVAVGSIQEMTDILDDGMEELELNVDNNDRATEIIKKNGYEYHMEKNIIVVRLKSDEISLLTKELVFDGIMLQGVNVKKKKLEDIFRIITMNGANTDQKDALLHKLGKGGVNNG